MRFLVKQVRYIPSSSQRNTMFLIEDKWDDWFKYETMYDLRYINGYGENLGALTREVFGYEVTHSGFHKMLREAVEEYRDYHDVVEHFNDELGLEAKAIIRTLIADLNDEVN